MQRARKESRAQCAHEGRTQTSPPLHPRAQCRFCEIEIAGDAEVYLVHGTRRRSSSKKFVQHVQRRRWREQTFVLDQEEPPVPGHVMAEPGPVRISTFKKRSWHSDVTVWHRLHLSLKYRGSGLVPDGLTVRRPRRIYSAFFRYVAAPPRTRIRGDVYLVLA